MYEELTLSISMLIFVNMAVYCLYPWCLSSVFVHVLTVLTLSISVLIFVYMAVACDLSLYPLCLSSVCNLGHTYFCHYGGD